MKKSADTLVLNYATMYETGNYQKARIVEFVSEYKKQNKGYPRRREIAEALDFSLSYALQLIRQMADEGTIKTSPPWDKKSKQWTTIVGLKRGAVQSASRVLLSRRAMTSMQEANSLVNTSASKSVTNATTPYDH